MKTTTIIEHVAGDVFTRKTTIVETPDPAEQNLTVNVVMQVDEDSLERAKDALHDVGSAQ